MASSIQIGPVTAAFERGGRLTVPIVVELQKPTKVRGIRARFRAAEETKADYTTTTTDSDGKTRTETKTAVQVSEFAAQDFTLAGGGPLGFFGSMKDGLATMLGGGQHELMPAGSYPYSVEINVPANGPASHAAKKSRVFYELSVQVDIPLASDLWGVQTFDLPPLRGVEPVPAPVRVCYPDEATGKRGLMDSMFGSNVQLEVALRADKVRIGQSIEGLIAVQSAKPIACRAIRARLVAVERTQAHGYTDSYRYTESAHDVDNPGEIVGEYSQRFTLPAEVQGPLTARGERFSVEWFVQVELDVPWSKDPTIQVPIELWPRE